LRFVHVTLHSTKKHGTALSSHENPLELRLGKPFSDRLVFYRWQKEFFDNGAAAFEKVSKGRRERESREAQRVAALEAKPATKSEVLSELMEEHVKLKKELGEL